MNGSPNTLNDRQNERATWTVPRYVQLLIIGLLILRLVLILDVLQHTDRAVMVDSRGYLLLANNLLAEGRFDSLQEPYLSLFRTPGYPVFLAPILFLGSGSLAGVLVVQWLVGALTSYVIFLFGSHYLNRRAGVIGAILFLLSPNALFWSATVMSEALFALGLAAATYLLGRAGGGKFTPWLPGILLGAITLIRPIGQYLSFFWAAWLLAYSRQIRSRSWQQALGAGAAVLAGTWLIILPWYFRNASLHDRFTLASVSETTLRSFHLALPIAEIEGISWDEAKIVARENPSTLAAFIQWFAADPVTFTRIQLRGILRVLIGTEVGTWMSVAWGSDYEGSGILGALLTGDPVQIRAAASDLARGENLTATLLLLWGGLYALVIWGAILVGVFLVLTRGSTEHRMLFVLLAITMLYLIASPGAAGEARFRVPIEPLMALLAGSGFASLRLRAGASS